jgi:hypothetical protein
MLDKAAQHRVFFFGECFIVFLQGVFGETGGRKWFLMVNLWWDCGGRILGLKNTPRFLDLFFGDSRFGNGFLRGSIYCRGSRAVRAFARIYGTSVTGSQAVRCGADRLWFSVAVF